MCPPWCPSGTSGIGSNMATYHKTIIMIVLKQNNRQYICELTMYVVFQLMD